MAESYQLNYLRGGTLKVFLAIANRIIPEDADCPGGGTLETAGVVDWALHRLPNALRKKFLLFFKVIQVLGIVFYLRPFTSLPPEKQDKLLRRLENGPLRLLRMGFFGIKTYICMGYYTREDVWQTIDYDGPVVAQRQFVDPLIRQLEQAKLKVES